MTHRHKRTLGNLLLAAGSLAASLAAAELSLRRFGPWSRGYYVIMPGSDWTFRAAPEVIRGVTGVSRFRINALGIRGRLFGPDGSEYRMLAVGGSTTECALLDDTEAWTSLLESRLGRTADGASVWVGNVGRSGSTTREHVLHLEYLLPQYPRIDAVVAMVGVNDMLTALRQGWAYELPAPVTDPSAKSAALRRAFAILPRPSYDRASSTGDVAVSWYRTTALWQLARRARLRWYARGTTDLGGDHLVRARLARQRFVPHVDSLPRLDAPLMEYRRNLNAMADIATARRVRLVFVTQATLWADAMTDSAERSIWFGWLGADPLTATRYYSTGALQRAMAAFNRSLLDVCRDRSLECIDAEALVPGDTTTLYDDMHFTEAGSRRVAELLAQYFAQRPPFVH